MVCRLPSLIFLLWFSSLFNLGCSTPGSFGEDGAGVSVYLSTKDLKKVDLVSKKASEKISQINLQDLVQKALPRALKKAEEILASQYP